MIFLIHGNLMGDHILLAHEVKLESRHHRNLLLTFGTGQRQAQTMPDRRGCTGKAARPDSLHGSVTVPCYDTTYRAALNQPRKRICVLKAGSIQMRGQGREGRVVKRQD